MSQISIYCLAATSSGHCNYDRGIKREKVIGRSAAGVGFLFILENPSSALREMDERRPHYSEILLNHRRKAHEVSHIALHRDANVTQKRQTYRMLKDTLCVSCYVFRFLRQRKLKLNEPNSVWVDVCVCVCVCVCCYKKQVQVWPKSVFTTETWKMRISHLEF